MGDESSKKEVFYFPDYYCVAQDLETAIKIYKETQSERKEIESDKLKERKRAKVQDLKK